LIALLKLLATPEKPRLGSGTSNKSSSTTSKEGTGIASRTEAEATVTLGTQGAHARLQEKELNQNKSIKNYKTQIHLRNKELTNEDLGGPHHQSPPHQQRQTDHLSENKKNSDEYTKARQIKTKNSGKAQHKLTYENITCWRVLMSGTSPLGQRLLRSSLSPTLPR